MSRYVVDASIAVKWFVPESHSEAAYLLLDDAHELLAPDLLLPEFGNIIWKKIRLREITRSDGRRIVQALMRVPLALHPSTSLLELGFEIAQWIDRTVYDSLYLALAVLHDCPMVTADRRLHNVVKRGPLGQNLRWIEEMEIG